MAETGHSADRRESILAAAEKVFDARGYSAATVEGVAEEAGIAKGSIYNYFKSKEDLFTQVFAAAQMQDVVQTDRLIGEDLLSAEKLSRLLDRWFERLGHYKRIGRLMLEVWAAAARQDRAGALAEILQKTDKGWSQRLASIIAQGIESGEFDREIDPAIVASLIMATANGATVQSILGTGAKIDEEFLAAFKRAVMATLSANADSKNTQ